MNDEELLQQVRSIAAASRAYSTSGRHPGWPTGPCARNVATATLLAHRDPQQVIMTTSKSQIGQTVWVYRGSMWAYPWYTSVRLTLEDPA